MSFIIFLKELWEFRKVSIVYPYLKISIVMLIISCFALIAFSKEPIRIAIVDTGITPNLKVPICENLSKDFTGYNTLNDNMGHGTVVSTLINTFAGTNYCQVILRVFDANDIKRDSSGRPYFNNSFANVTNAMKYLNTIKVNIINLSLGGQSGDKEEQKLFESILDKKIYIVNAAGNEGLNLDTQCNWFPGCYDSRIIMVGNLLPNKLPNPSSNYGKRVNVWIIGTNIKIGSQTYTGTSFSAALLSGAMVKVLNEQRK